MSCSQNNNIAEFEIDGSIANYEKQLVSTSDPSAFTLLLVTDLVNFYRFNLNNFEKKKSYFCNYVCIRSFKKWSASFMAQQK